MFRIAFAAALVAATAFEAGAVNLVVNGDFEAGDTGFGSDHTFAPGNFGAAQYGVVTNPSSWNGAFVSYGDKTTGSGLMMIVNGSTAPADVAWSQSVAVSPTADYKFSLWTSSAFGAPFGALDIQINGVSIGALTAPATTGVWEMSMFSWSAAGATTADIDIVETSTGFGGNDYALDDIRLEQTGVGVIPLPAALPMLAVATAALGFASRRRAS